MLRNTVLIGLVLGISASVPILYQTNPDAVMALLSSGGDEPVTVAAAPRPQPAAAAPTNPSARRAALTADERGHFVGEFKINGRSVEALIDTGATSVALNLSTARRLGLKIMPSDMTGFVNTANGRTKATSVMIERIAIGRVTVRDVPALVLDDASLGVALIGMTFLNRLKKYEVDGQTIVLMQ